MKKIQSLLAEIGQLKSGLHAKDFLLTWEQTPAELRQVLMLADAIKRMRGENIDTRVFGTGIGVSVFRDNSTRTRFSYASALNLLGLTSAGPGRRQVADRARRNGARDRQHDLVLRRRRRHPRRHVPGRGQRLHARSRRGARRRLCPGRAAAAPGGHQPAVRHRPPDAEHGRPGLAARALRQPGQAQGQEDRHDLGLLAELRQAAVGAAGHHRPDDALRHGRHAGPPRGLRPDSGGGEGGAQERQGQRRQLPPGGHDGRGLQGRRHRLPQVLGALQGDAAAHQAAARQRPRRPEGAGKVLPDAERRAQALALRRGDDEAHRQGQGALHALPAGGHHRRVLRAVARSAPPSSKSTASRPTRKPAGSPTSSPR